MSQNYQKVPKLCDLSMKIAPDLKEKKSVFVTKNFKNWASFGVKISIFLTKWRLLVTAHNFVKTMRSLGEIVKILCDLWVRAMLKMGVFLTALHMTFGLGLPPGRKSLFCFCPLTSQIAQWYRRG